MGQMKTVWYEIQDQYDMMTRKKYHPETIQKHLQHRFHWFTFKLLGSTITCNGKPLE